MKTKGSGYQRIFFTVVLLFTVPVLKMYSQDSLKLSSQIADSKLQLLEYKQKILESRIELMETKPQQKDIGLKKQMDSVILILNRTRERIKRDTIAIKPFTKAITFNPFRILEGTLQLGYEKAVKNNLSIEVSLLGTYVTQQGIGGAYLKDQQFGFTDILTNSYIDLNGKMITGLGGMVRLKNYLLTRVNPKSKAPVGLYAAPQLMYRRIWITGNYYNYPDWTQKEMTRNLDIVHGGVIIGGKIIIAKVLCLDMYVGGVMRLSKYYNESTLTKYKRWYNIDYSGILPTAGINLGILK